MIDGSVGSMEWHEGRKGRTRVRVAPTGFCVYRGTEVRRGYYILWFSILKKLGTI